MTFLSILKRIMPAKVLSLVHLYILYTLFYIAYSLIDRQSKSIFHPRQTQDLLMLSKILILSVLIYSSKNEQLGPESINSFSLTTSRSRLVRLYLHDIHFFV